MRCSKRCASRVITLLCGSGSDQRKARKSLTSHRFSRAPAQFSFRWRISSGIRIARAPSLRRKWRNHTGTDYAAPLGTPVRAIGDGMVVAVGRMGGYGNMIDIRHVTNGYAIPIMGTSSRFARGFIPSGRPCHDGEDHRVPSGMTGGGATGPLPPFRRSVSMSGWLTT